MPLPKVPIKVSESQGYVKFKFDGVDLEYICSVADWEMKLRVLRLQYEYGVPESEIDELVEWAKRVGYEERDD